MRTHPSDFQRLVVGAGSLAAVAGCATPKMLEMQQATLAKLAAIEIKVGNKPVEPENPSNRQKPIPMDFQALSAALSNTHAQLPENPGCTEVFTAVRRLVYPLGFLMKLTVDERQHIFVGPDGSTIELHFNTEVSPDGYEHRTDYHMYLSGDKQRGFGTDGNTCDDKVK